MALKHFKTTCLILFLVIHGIPTYAHTLKNDVAVQQNSAMMQQIPARFDQQNVDSFITSVQNRNDLHPTHPSTTDLSFTVSLSQEAAALRLFLKVQGFTIRLKWAWIQLEMGFEQHSTAPAGPIWKVGTVLATNVSESKLELAFCL